MNTNISSMLHSLLSGDKVAAEDMFNSIITDKVSAKFDEMKVDVANDYFGLSEDVEQLEATDERLTDHFDKE